MQSEKEIDVRDPFVRLFHWGLACGFFIAYLTEDELMRLHVWAGYLALSLVLLRLVWGFIGNTRARFGDFTMKCMKRAKYRINQAFYILMLFMVPTRFFVIRGN